jgi:hypothetical protein
VAADIVVSHDEVIQAYQDRLAVLTRENITLGLVCKKQQLQLAEQSKALPSQTQTAPNGPPDEPAPAADADPADR